MATSSPSAWLIKETTSPSLLDVVLNAGATPARPPEPRATTFSALRLIAPVTATMAFPALDGAVEINPSRRLIRRPAALGADFSTGDDDGLFWHPAHNSETCWHGNKSKMCVLVDWEQGSKFNLR